MKTFPIAITLFLAAFTACTSQVQKDDFPSKTEISIENPTNRVVLHTEVNWEPLNPARGDASPKAGTLWGNRNEKVPTGFLAQFADGFSSPPHIHNITYRAVVISGSIHNDDPSAEKMWMKPGSFWTQPVGEAHITAAKGEKNWAYVEIDHGPYLVKPTEEAFDNGERPINIDASNVVWLGSDKTSWIEENTNASLSHLWQNDSIRGLFIQLPSTFVGTVHSLGDVFHAVVIKGQLEYTLPENGATKTLEPGSYFTSTAEALHSIKTQENTVIYIRTNRALTIGK